MKILVTGGCGYIGSTTARLLQRAGYEVWVADDLSEGHAAAWDGPMLQVQLREEGQVAAMAAQHRFDGIVHFAARAYIGESMQQPLRYWRCNLLPLLHLCACFRGVPIVFSSTCAVYGEPEVERLEEHLPLQPVNPYGASKMAAERVLSDRALAGAGSYVALRYFNAAGAEDDGLHGEDHRPEPHILPRAIQNALGQLEEPLQIYGTDWPTADGTCVRDFIHIEDLAAAHLMALQYLLEQGESVALNLGTGQGHSVMEVIQAVTRLVAKVEWQETARRPGDPARLVAGVEKARQLLGWTAQHSQLENIITTAARWHQQFPGGYPT